MIARRYILNLRYLLDFRRDENEKKNFIVFIMHLLQSLFSQGTLLWQSFLDFDTQLL